MQIENIPISSTIPDPNNVRLHSPRNLAVIMGSLKKFGQQKPIVVDENNIVLAGNGTREAALALGWDEIAVVRSSLKDWQATAYALADNRSSELAEWDHDALNSQLVALEAIPDFTLQDIGFDDFDDWNSDLGAEVDKTDANLDGIAGSIKIELPIDQKDDCLKWLKKLIKESIYDAKVS